MQHGRVPDRHIVAEGRRTGAAHHVHDTPVLDVRASPDTDRVDVTPQHSVHPDTAVVADDDVTDALSALIDERRRCDARMDGPVRPKHKEDYTREGDRS